jgi:DNA-binding transcriptional LysR family regulator
VGPQLIHMQVFLALAETRSVSTAARRLHLAPSRISERIAELESDLGAVLIDRSTRPATITAAGESLRPRARAIVAEFETIAAVFRTGHPRPYRVGVRSLPTEFRETWTRDVLRPGIGRSALSLQPLESECQIAMLRAQELELGMIWTELQADTELDQLPVLEERFAVALPDIPRFHRLEHVGPHDLAGLRLATNIEPWSFPAALHPYLEMLPVVDRIDAAVEDALAILLSGGQHCALVPVAWQDHSNFSAPADERILVRRLREPEPTVKTFLTWRRDMADEPDVKRVVDLARRHFPEPVRR